MGRRGPRGGRAVDTLRVQPHHGAGAMLCRARPKRGIFLPAYAGSDIPAGRRRRMGMGWLVMIKRGEPRGGLAVWRGVAWIMMVLEYQRLLGRPDTQRLNVRYPAEYASPTVSRLRQLAYDIPPTMPRLGTSVSSARQQAASASHPRPPREPFQQPTASRCHRHPAPT